MSKSIKQLTKIKICGMTNQADVDLAVSLNVDALGFILAKSPRKISLEKAEELTAQLPPFISRIAVVVNPDKNQLEKIISSRIFTDIQFHGSENPELFNDIPLRTIKAISISDESDLPEIPKYKDWADYLLFDTKIGDKTGGTGKSFDWSLLDQISLTKNYILAGGLGPDNIEEALNRLNPAAVDLNSRLEISPGNKDPELMKEAVNLIKTHNKRN